MRARRQARARRVAWILGLAGGLFGAVLASEAAPRHRVQLADGRELDGLVVPATAGTWVVQAEGVCVEVAAADIRRVDGREGIAALDPIGEPLLRADSFEQILENGDVVVHMAFSRENRGRTMIDRIEWGIAPHESSLVADWKVFDEFGNDLAMHVTDVGGGRRHALAALVRPCVPGETLRFSNRTLHRGMIAHDGELLVYRHRGDYPEDRLVTKMVRLPAGADIVSVSPAPVQRFDHEGAPYVLWRRYYVAGEERPLEIRYRSAK